MHKMLLPFLLLTGCDGLRAWVIRHWPQDYEAQAASEGARPSEKAGSVWPAGVPLYDGPDASLTPIAIGLDLVASGFSEPTDIQFVPGSTTEMLVLEKQGRALWVNLETGSQVEVLTIDVPTKSEQGLLGAAFHPQFADNGRIYLNHSMARGENRYSAIDMVTLNATRQVSGTPLTILQVAQPYANHNAGQLAFGPDGMLYIGWGDGGWRADPKGHGQNPQTLLGSMLRIDVDRQDPGKNYAVPPDNPWVDTSGVAPEAWAIGLRNPWRYSFAPDGRLVVADVGQDAWEEVAIVAKGENHGWNIREGSHCFEPSSGCASDGLTMPIYEYSHASGQSITGGYVYTGSEVPTLQGRYVFADFVTGRLWAISLPESKGLATAPRALGRWPMLPSTFAQDAAGEMYVADYGRGRIFKISSASPASE